MAGPSMLLAQQRIEIPKVFSRIKHDKKGKMYFENQEQKRYESDQESIPLSAVIPSFTGTETGFDLKFANEAFRGKIYFGFIPYGDSRHPQPVFFKTTLEVNAGKTSLNIADLDGKYDMINWEKNGYGTIGYRVLDAEGQLLYDGRMSFKGSGPFEEDITMIEGPTIHVLSAEGAVIAFRTNKPTTGEIEVGGIKFYEEKPATIHEMTVSGLQPNTAFEYTVKYGPEAYMTQSYSFKTAPKSGSRTKFTFAYASDSRAGQGGGERDSYGANAYIMKKIMALAMQQEVSFFQFSGDLINGYLTDPQSMKLQYHNWKSSVEPFLHYFPTYISMGNHEALSRQFSDDKGSFTIDRFPFETESAEIIFAQEFVNPMNGPDSEDGASYDPDPNNKDFPTYKENVFYYTYDNVGVIVLNSDYLYTPNKNVIPFVGGGLHGYIMDQQLAWFEKTMQEMETNENIDHVFVTQHTPCFPNGGHVQDDMWYGGNNQYRPFIAGKPLKKGIIERRDQLLDQIVNKSTKAIAILTGDEHNYALTTLNEETPIYPDLYLAEKIKLTRTVYQVNNGAAGAPYYAQEQTPWSAFVSGFTTQNALVLFHVDGESLEMEVLNPDTLEEIMRKKLR
jgi:hypothetical protein